MRVEEKQAKSKADGQGDKIGNQSKKKHGGGHGVAWESGHGSE